MSYGYMHIQYARFRHVTEQLIAYRAYNWLSVLCYIIIVYTHIELIYI